MSHSLAVHGLRRGPLTGLVDPEGHAGYALAEAGTWAVEAGPIADARFRRTALDLCEQALVGFDRASADKLLTDERVQVVVGVSQGAAERFAKRLGPQGTGAKAVPTAALAKPNPWRGGLPVLALVAGVAFGWVVFTWWLGVLLGGGAAAASYTLAQKRAVPVLGAPPEPPPMPGATTEAIAAIRGGNAAVRRAAAAVLRVVDQLLDGEDFLAIASGGLDGGIGRSAYQALGELGRIARAGLSESAVNPVADQAEAFAQAVPSLTASLRAAPGQSATFVAEAEQGLGALVQALIALR